MNAHTATHSADTTAALLKAAADPLRLKILKLLQLNSFGALELSAILDIKQNALSHHLKLLASNHLVETRREGNSIFYRLGITSNTIETSLIKAIYESSAAIKLDAPALQRLEETLNQRRHAAQSFFDKVGKDFDEHQERIADASAYNAVTLEVLDASSASNNNALEVGCGAGELLGALAQRFKHVVALDFSSEMLSRAKKQTSAKNIEFKHGDINSLDTNDKYDAIVLAMVLHHLPAPAELFIQASARLKNGGTLTITDLCQHDQEWAQSRCGDLWMGFNTDDVDGWATAAGLEVHNASYLAQRNGFQIFTKQYSKSKQEVS